MRYYIRGSQGRVEAVSDNMKNVELSRMAQIQMILKFFMSKKEIWRIKFYCDVDDFNSLISFILRMKETSRETLTVPKQTAEQRKKVDNLTYSQKFKNDIMFCPRLLKKAKDSR